MVFEDYFTLKNNGYKIREWKKRASLCANEEVDLTGRWDEYKNRSGDSVNFLYSVITNQASNDEHGTRTSFRNALLPKEIKQNFPQPSVFAEANPSYEEVRKLIILLFSYTAWYRMQFGKSEYDKNYEYDVYYDELNNILFEANMPMLYAGNPYDWLFMRCAAEDNPLDAFRGILGEALSEEDF